MGDLPTTAALLGAAAQPTDAAAPAGHSPLVRFSGQEATPAVAAYLGQDDSLQVLIFPSIGNTSVLLEIRFMRPDGTISPMEETIAVPTAYGPVTFNRKLGEGYILTASLSVPGAGAMRGAIWAQLNVLRGFPPAGTFAYTLVQGYVGQRAAVYWPYGPTYSPTDGTGFLVVFDITPAAGNDFIFTSTLSTRNKVLAVFGTFTTSAAVATRVVQIDVRDNLGQVAYRLPAPSSQAASLVQSYAAAPGAPQQALTNQVVNIELPVELKLAGGFVLRSTVSNIQAADAWSNVKIYVEQWVDI